jgi:hypothetical protein
MAKKIGEMVDSIPEEYREGAYAMFLAGVSVGQKFGDDLRICPDAERLDILSHAFETFFRKGKQEEGR